MIHIGNKRIMALYKTVEVPVDSKLPQVLDKSVTEITAADFGNIVALGDYAFYKCTYLSSITIPYSVKSIGNYAFYHCDGLTSIEIPNSVKSIGSYAFSSCEDLTSIEIPDSVNSLGGSAFQQCPNLTSVIIGSGITALNGNTFFNCTSLTEILIPPNITTMKGYDLRMGSTTNKATIYIANNTPPTISTTTFDSTKLEKIVVPTGTGDIYKAATNWSAFADYIVEYEEASA